MGSTIIIRSQLELCASRLGVWGTEGLSTYKKGCKQLGNLHRNVNDENVLAEYRVIEEKLDKILIEDDI